MADLVLTGDWWAGISLAELEEASDRAPGDYAERTAIPGPAYLTPSGNRIDTHDLLSNSFVDPIYDSGRPDCISCSPRAHCPEHDPSWDIWQEPPTSSKYNNEAASQTRQERQEMEVETNLATNRYSQHPPFTKTGCGLIQDPPDPYRAPLLHPMNEPLFTYPGDSSNVPDTIDRYDTGDVHEAAGILYNGTMNDAIYNRPLQPTTALDTDLNFVDLMTEPVHVQESFPAYAKLVLGDGDYYVTTHDVTIGRNMEAYKEYLRADKAQQDAQAALHDYRQEPSMPSQPGDQDQPGASSSSLEGRPAPQSTASEHGGVVYYQTDPDGDSIRYSRRRKRKLQQISKSSSTTSVAPASLHHTEAYDEMTENAAYDENGEPLIRTHAFVPVHTSNKEDIRYISKEHLLLSFNFQQQCWQMEVLGPRAKVNIEDVLRGVTVPLEHNDEVTVSSLRFVFKLPDNSRRSSGGMSRGTFESEDELSDEGEDARAPSTSPARRLSNAIDFSDDDELGAQEQQPSKPSLKLKLKASKVPRKDSKAKKSKDKGKGKEQAPEPAKKGMKKETSLEPSPEATKKPDKGKKPKAAAKEPTLDAGKPTPDEPLQIEPGSALASIPVEELPEKRKGPGRPPKNGLVSKRDQALVAKKQKEFEKRGEPVPEYKQLIDLVRAETKFKEAQQKQTNGGAPSATDNAVMPTIERDPNLLPKLSSGPSTSKPIDLTGATASASAEPTRRSSPKPKRTAKSPSPVKPREHFTDEQLKKPGKTYMYILDDLLSEHPDGQADLQEIYDLIMKRYPFFKYNAGTHGWQSSVRHNLLQHDRFMEVGKSGKGKFWAINPDVPLEKEKKRRMTPPPGRVSMPNGQFMPPGQAPYGNPYAPQNGRFPAGQPGGPGYCSPYGQPGSFPGQPQTYPRPSQQRHANAQAHHNPPPPPNPQFGSLITEIMNWRAVHLQPYTTNNVPDSAKVAVFNGVMGSLSDMFHGEEEVEATPPEEYTEEQRVVWEGLHVLFKKHKDLKKMAEAQQVRQPPIRPNQGSVQQAVGQAVQNGNGVGSGVLVPVVSASAIMASPAQVHAQVAISERAVPPAAVPATDNNTGPAFATPTPALASPAMVQPLNATAKRAAPPDDDETTENKRPRME